MPNLGRLHFHLQRTHTSLSKPRDLIYGQLEQNISCSAQQLIVTLSGKVGRATVYRTIKHFLRLGIIDELSPGQYELTDRFKQHHHYFICRHCKKPVAFADDTLEKALMHLTTRRGLTLENHKVELTGLCSLCVSKTTPQSAIGTNLRRPPGLS